MASRNVPLPLVAAEAAGTFVLVAVGVSFVIVAFGAGSPVVVAIPSAGLRRLLTGFLFGSTGALIAVSPLGKLSGAHINPVVTLAFWLRRHIGSRLAAAYVAAQLTGAALAAAPLLAWGPMGGSVAYGATLPGSSYGAWYALAGEAATTSALVGGLLFFVGSQRRRRFTPLLFPFLYACMVWAEAPVSGTSTNPARTLGSALAAGQWHDWWVYLLGPVAGTLLALAAHRVRLLGTIEIEVAKLYHFEHDRFGVLGVPRLRRPNRGG
jgi:aquaporin Z